MKFKACKTRMNDIVTELNINAGGTQRKIINVPTHQCPGCIDIIMDNLMREKAKVFAKWESGQVVDYAQCEQNEADIFTTLHTFGT